MNTIYSYVKLTLKTFPLFWGASKFYSIILFVIIPFQAILPSLTLWFSKGLIDAISTTDTIVYSIIIFFVLAWIVVSFLNAILGPLEMTFQGLMTDKLIAQLNKSLMDKSSEIKGLYYFENPEFYDDIQVLEQEAAWRPVNLIVFTSGMISSALTGISMLVLLTNFNIWIACIIFVAIVPQAIVTYRLQKEAFETLVTNSPEARKMQYYSSVMLSKEHIKEVKLYNTATFFINKYMMTFNKIHTDIKKIRYKQACYSIVFVGIGMVGIGFSFWWVVNGVLNNTFTAGDILIFASSILLARQSLASFIENSSLLYDTLLYMEKYFKFISLKSDITSGEKILSLEKNEFTIRFNNVSFQYPNSSKLILDNISFTINMGEKIALVGENGAGKSTIVKLITRLYEPTEGIIELNGIDITEYEIDAYRKIIGIVFQDFSRYQLTYKENILISNTENTNDDGMLAIVTEKSGLEELVGSFEHGYEQVLSKNFDNGTELSGGEWQKVAIARAYFRNAAFLILDEPSASLDARSEHQMLETLTDLSATKTLLLITHKLSALNMVDRIIVLQDGHIAEEGSMQELLTSKGYFAELYQLQANKYVNW
ncbi:ABC transporter ATP-binding protein [Lysinibacillus mangiferihumi]|uniref:ABC transporter ATP-binding protein n=1 Tax=Lysinibacillus mangiferihumi TaxID=1130819 RepID=A0A4V5TI70_9BACI|nr:ABC transporter ATP-binding protein [Lysinibacillus mangiferihumi]TKI53843.1 ABC transporter ATP-binding protein [Lysinibacillus mangiferihumi]